MSQKGFGVIYILVGVLILSFVAGGAYFLGKSSEPKPSTPVVSQTPQPTPSPTPDETVNWKTYTDVKNGFELKYPSNAEVSSQKLYSMLSVASSDGISIAPPYQEPYDKYYSFDIVVRNNPNNLDAKSTINNYAEDIKKNCSPPACGVPKMIADTLKPYKTGDLDEYIFHTGAETNSAIVVQVQNNKTYIFRMTGDQGNVSDPYGLRLFDQILSTFKFTQ